jgi:hypothetical protein
VESERDVEPAPELQRQDQGVVEETQVVGWPAVDGGRSIGATPTALEQGDLAAYKADENVSPDLEPPVHVPPACRPRPAPDIHVLRHLLVAGTEKDEAVARDPLEESPGDRGHAAL